MEANGRMSTTYVMRNSEDAEQETVIQWARICSGKWPELKLLHHIPNGGRRNAKEAAKLKRMGVLAGVSDLHLPVARGGYHSLYIEMKYDEGRLLKSQKDFLQAAAAEGNYCTVCYSAADAIEILDLYMHGRTIENLSILKGGKSIGTVR